MLKNKMDVDKKSDSRMCIRVKNQIDEAAEDSE